jgi:hypothetical protein
LFPFSISGIDASDGPSATALSLEGWYNGLLLGRLDGIAGLKAVALGALELDDILFRRPTRCAGFSDPMDRECECMRDLEGRLEATELREARC